MVLVKILTGLDISSCDFSCCTKVDSHEFTLEKKENPFLSYGPHLDHLLLVIDNEITVLS